MPTVGTTIISNVRDLVQDPNGIRWIDAELLRWINEAQKDIVRRVPGSSTALKDFTLFPGTAQEMNGTDSPGIAPVAPASANFDGTTTLTAVGTTFIADGWAAGNTIRVAGSTSNDGDYTILSVTDLIITITGTWAIEAFAGLVSQVQPIDAWAVLDVEINRGLFAAKADGDAMRQMSRKDLDDYQRGWPNGQTATAASLWARDRHSRTRVYTWPPMPAANTQNVRAVVSIAPTDLAADTDPLSLEPRYDSPVVDYVCWRAFNKDSDFAANSNRAAMFRASYDAALKSEEDEFNTMFAEG